MEQHVKIDLAAQGWYSQKGGASSKGHFRRKYMFARPKYTAEKLHKIREIIHKRRKEEIAEEHERQRKEQEEAVNKEAETGKRKQMEEEEAKAQRLTDLKSKAEALRQEKSTLFGMLKQALIEEAKKKQREEKAERIRKEEQDKKDKKERALAEAAQALAGANMHSGMSAMMAGKMGQMGAILPSLDGRMVGGVPGMVYGHKAHGAPTHGAPFLSPRQGFYGAQPQDSPRGVAPQGAAATAPGSAGRLQPFSQAAGGYGSPQVGVGGVGHGPRSMLGSLQGQNQRFMNMQAYQNQNALLAGRMAAGAMGGARSDARPLPPAPPPMDGRDAAAQQVGQQQPQPGQGMGAGGRGRGGMFYPLAGGRGYPDRRW